MRPSPAAKDCLPLAKREGRSPAELPTGEAFRPEWIDFKRGIRVGKFMEIELEGGSRAELEKKIDDACQKLLSNPVIEEYSFEIV